MSRRPIRGLRWYIGGPAVPLDGHQLHRPPDAERPRAVPEDRVSVDQHRLRVGRSSRSASPTPSGRRSPGRLLDRLGTCRGLSLDGAVVLGRRDGDVAGRRAAQLRRVPLSARARRGRQLAGRDQGRVGMVPAPRERLGGRPVRQRVIGRRRARAVHRAGIYHAFGSWRPAFVAHRRARLRVAAALPRVLPASRGSPAALGGRARRTSSRARDRCTPHERAGPHGAAVRDAAASAADLGLHPLEELHRPGVVLHHRLVRDLSRGQGLPARREPARLLGAVPRRRCRQLLRRRRVEHPHRARLVGRCGPRS